MIKRTIPNVPPEDRELLNEGVSPEERLIPTIKRFINRVRNWLSEPI